MKPIMIRYRRDLWKLFGGKPKLTMAELGVAEGLFSAEMLSWPFDSILYMVDRWACVPTCKGDSSNPKDWHASNLMQAMARVESYGLRVRILRGDTVAMADSVRSGELDLVYVDADHSYEGVKRDIEAWYSKLIFGGVMAFHDFENSAYGVKQAVTEFCRSRRLQIHLLPEDKPEDAGAYFYANSIS